MDEELNKLIDKYLDEGLSLEETEELNDLLLSSKEFRSLFRKKVRVHSDLMAHYDAQDMKQLYGLNQADSAKVIKFNPIRYAAAAAILILAFSLLINQTPEEPLVTLARINYSEAAKWNRDLENQESLLKGRYTLKSGMVELKLPHDVTVAIEGPASFSLINDRTMQLHDGRLSADVGEKGKGFVVITPEGKVVDLGTRFGVFVPKEGKTEAHVFQGEINVVVNEKITHLTENKAIKILENGRLIEMDVDDYVFPMPGYSLNKNLSNGDFESGKNMEDDWPTKTGYWGGDHCEVVGSFGGVQPVKGEKMLRFVKAHLRHAQDKGHNNSQLWQVIDLRKHRDEILHGGTSARMKALFNRSSKSSGQATFSISLLAFDGEMKDVKQYWNMKNSPMSEMIAQSSSKLVADEDPETWEQVSCQLDIPKGTDFVLVQVAAQNFSKGEKFAGHFLDAVSVIFHNSPRKSSPSLEWEGKGDFLDAKNWKDQLKPDFKRHRVLLMGEEAIIDKRVELKQDLIIAINNQSKGALRIAKSGELNISKNGSLLVGYNTEAVALLTIEGVLRTASKSNVGRNNIKSDVIIDGGLWESLNGVRMAQYGERLPDTHAKIKIINGGQFKSTRLDMIHDFATLELHDGEVELNLLTLGGSDGEAIFRHLGGKVKLNKLVFGPLKSVYEFGGDQPELILKGRFKFSELMALENATWKMGQDALKEEQLQISYLKEDGQEMTRIKVIPNSF